MLQQLTAQSEHKENVEELREGTVCEVQPPLGFPGSQSKGHGTGDIRASTPPSTGATHPAPGGPEAASGGNFRSSTRNSCVCPPPISSGHQIPKPSRSRRPEQECDQTWTGQAPGGPNRRGPFCFLAQCSVGNRFSRLDPIPVKR